MTATLYIPPGTGTAQARLTLRDGYDVTTTYPTREQTHELRAYIVSGGPDHPDLAPWCAHRYELDPAVMALPWVPNAL